MYSVVYKKMLYMCPTFTSLIVKSTVYSFRIFIYSAFLISVVCEALYISNFGVVRLNNLIVIFLNLKYLISVQSECDTQ